MVGNIPIALFHIHSIHRSTYNCIHQQNTEHNIRIPRYEYDNPGQFNNGGDGDLELHRARSRYVAHSGGSLGKSVLIPTSRAGNNLGRVCGQEVQGLVLCFYAWDWIHINYTLSLIVSYTKLFLSKAYVCNSRHNRGSGENTCTTDTMYIVNI